MFLLRVLFTGVSMKGDFCERRPPEGNLHPQKETYIPSIDRDLYTPDRDLHPLPDRDLHPMDRDLYP